MRINGHPLGPAHAENDVAQHLVSGVGEGDFTNLFAGHQLVDPLPGQGKTLGDWCGWTRKAPAGLIHFVAYFKLVVGSGRCDAISPSIAGHRIGFAWSAQRNESCIGLAFVRVEETVWLI